jgi:hypothetical protein
MHYEAASGHFYICIGLGIYGGGACLHSLQMRLQSHGWVWEGVCAGVCAPIRSCMFLATVAGRGRFMGALEVSGQLVADCKQLRSQSSGLQKYIIFNFDWFCSFRLNFAFWKFVEQYL